MEIFNNLSRRLFPRMFPPVEKRKWITNFESDEDETWIREEALRVKEQAIERLMYYCILYEDVVEKNLRHLKHNPAAWLRAKQWYTVKEMLLRDSWKKLLESKEMDMSDVQSFIIQIPKENKVRQSCMKQYRGCLDIWIGKANEVTLAILTLRKHLHPVSQNKETSSWGHLAEYIQDKVYDCVIGALGFVSYESLELTPWKHP